MSLYSMIQNPLLESNMNFGNTTLKWKYKIALTDKTIFKDFENLIGTKFPSDLQSLIVTANGATPDKSRFDLPEESGKSFGSMYTFNRTDLFKTDCDSFIIAQAAIPDNHYIPFGTTPSGDSLVYNISNGIVYLWEHETNHMVSTEKPLERFISSLY